MQNRRTLTALLLLVLFAPVAASSAFAAEPPKRAELHVSGLGWWRDRELRIALERMLGGQRGTDLNANAIEDAAFLIVSVLNDEGFQKPVVTVRAQHADGRAATYRIDAALDMNIPRDIRATAVRFAVETGPRSYVETVDFEGLDAIAPGDAAGYFKPSETLIATEASRAYSQSKVRRAAENLRDALRQRGFAQARVEAQRAGGDGADAAAGPVTIRVRVEQGPVWKVESRVFPKADPSETGYAKPFEAGTPWPPAYQQNLGEEIRQAYYKKGYADVVVRVRAEPGEAQGASRPVRVVVEVEPGPLVKVGEVRFSGNQHTNSSVLRRRVRVAAGAPLNPVQLERARYRLSRLGVFDAVDLHYEPVKGEVRDPVYLLREGPRYEASLLAGYGSYEEVRGGVELRQMNLFGRAHQSRLELVKSMKSTRGDYTYNVPELFGESIDGSARVFGLEREELAFVRQEYGTTVALKRQVPWIRAEGSVGYTFQTLRNADNELATRAADEKQVTVASIDLALTQDRRDSPLRPRRGYRWFARVEAASQGLGGEVDYERIELGGAYHLKLGRSQWLHLGLTHGLITTLGTTDESLPVNKRFYPGGDSSIRGYQDGEAAPRGADGRFIGAKTYLLLNAEYEQALTKSWSAVAFVDALGAAARLADYPFDERLYSVGLGLRYQTIVGPIRLEYGRNLNRREGDPTGTLHLSIGFPF